MAVNRVRRNGSYAPLSAHYYKDDKLAEAGEAAELLFVRGLAFSADILKDGFISDVQVTRFVGVGMDDALERAERLVAAGLWRRDKRRGGFHIKSWAKWNASLSEIKAKQIADAARKAGGK